MPEMLIGDNLDARNDEGVLIDYATGYSLLADYARYRSLSILSRKSGDIEYALRMKDLADDIYKRLPDWAKTW